MDPLSLIFMDQFTKEYVNGNDLHICDVGSMDVYGTSNTFKPFFQGHRYLGLDIQAGPNVDIVTDDPYRYPVEENTYDVVISGSTMEHVEDLHKWVLELKRITKKGGLICIIAPAYFQLEHRYPVDCWRIYPDGMKFLLEKIAGLKVLNVRLQKKNRCIACMGVAQK